MLPTSEQNHALADDCIVDNLATAAARCGIGVGTLRRALYTGKGPRVTWLAPRRIGIQRRHLREWLESQSGPWRPWRIEREMRRKASSQQPRSETA